MKRYLVVTLTILIACASLRAQTTAQISGNVKDSTGAVIPGADVTATQTDTGISRSTITGADGNYVLPSLPVGPYRLQVSMTGFTTYVQTGIVLTVNSNPAISAVLNVGSIAEQVEVNANAAMVETRDNAVGQLISQESVLELPLQGRQTTDLIALSGAANYVSTTTSGGRTYPGSVSVSLAGGLAAGTMFYLDGGFHMDSQTNQGLPMPFPDALREFKVETGTLPANYGNHAGGAVSAVTKSGTNELHGDVFEFIRNYAFNARNFFALSRDSLKRNQFGGVLGGPIVKGKLFFFGGYQYTDAKTTPSDSISYVHTAASLKGDFTAFASAACNSGKAITLKAPFVNNMVDPALFSLIALKALALVPVSTDPCGKIQYRRLANNSEHQIIGRADWQQAANNSVFFRYFLGDSKFPVKQLDPANILSSNTGSTGRLHAITLGDTFVINPATILSVRIAFSRSANQRLTWPNMPSPTDLDVKQTSLMPNYFYWDVTGYLGFTPGAPGPFTTNSWQISEDLSLMRGSHQISIGAPMITTHMNGRGNFQLNGRFYFNGGTTGKGLGDFMLGIPSQFTQGGTQWGDDVYNAPSFYIQDNWKVSSKVTLNMGLRWDPYLPQISKVAMNSHFEKAWFDQGLQSKVFKNAPVGTLFYGDSGMPERKANTFGKMDIFSPRFGFVYDPRGKGQETIRAAYGIYYETNYLWQMMYFTMNAPWGQTITINSPTGGLADPWKGYPGGDPYPTPIPPPSTIGFPAIAGSYVSMPLHTNQAYTQQWNLAVQKQFPADWMLSVSYVGNKSTHMWTGTEVNPAPFIPGNCKAGQYGLPADGPCSTAANVEFRRVLYLQNPQRGAAYGSIKWMDDGGNANFHGLLLSAQHRMSQNFSLNTNYTWSHCLNDQEQILDIKNQYNDPSNRAGDRANCSYDVRQNFSSSLVIKSPKFSRSWLRRVAGDWQISGIFRARTGSYLDLTTGREYSIQGIRVGNPNTFDRPNLVADWKLDDPTYNKWFDPAAFAYNSTGTLGNAGRNIVTGPGRITFDMGLSRTFSIREGQDFQIRAEAFNVFNHTNFGNPNVTMSSAQFSKISSAADPRIMQFALKYTF